MSPTRTKLDPLLDRLCAPSGPLPRALMVVAHPDDETLGAGARLHRFEDLLIVHLTDGAPRDPYFANRAGYADGDAYAAARRQELHAAMAIAGVREDQLRRLGRVDQDASLDMVRLAHEIADIIDERKPELVLTHPYEGGHPDHDAAAFSVAAAVRLQEQRGAAPPAVIEMAYYHEEDDIGVYSRFLDIPDIDVRVVPLSPAELDTKRRMIACHASQAEVLARFPIDAERFRRAPAYDFLAPPHDGTLHFEKWRWSIDGPRWRALAKDALAALALG